jgi:hypothetical protein
MSAATLRAIRNGWLLAARDARYRPYAELAPGYVVQARRVQRQLLALRGGRP